jgi:hypothetical protein
MWLKPPRADGSNRHPDRIIPVGQMRRSAADR